MSNPADPLSAAFAITVGDEGGLSMDPADPGNWTGGACGLGTLVGTKFGISAAQFPTLDIPNLSLVGAKAIFSTQYWLPAACDKLPWPVSQVVADGEYNSGGEGAKALQEVLGVTVDGDIGPMTLLSVANWDPVELACRTSAKRAEWYVSLNNSADIDGWEKRLFINLWQAATAT